MNLTFNLKAPDSKFENYSYLYICEKSQEALLIDPAWGMSTYKKALEENGISKFSVLLTHRHIDHRESIPELIKEYDCDVWLSKIEAEYYEYECENQRLIENFGVQSIGTIDITVFHTPGHTKGGLCFLIDDNFYSGDTLFAEGCGVCHCKGGDPIEMYVSLEAIKSNLTDSTKIFPGHSYRLPIGTDFKFIKRYNRYLRFTDVEKFVKKRMELIKGF